MLSVLTLHSGLLLCCKSGFVRFINSLVAELKALSFLHRFLVCGEDNPGYGIYCRPSDVDGDGALLLLLGACHPACTCRRCKLSVSGRHQRIPSRPVPTRVHNQHWSRLRCPTGSGEVQGHPMLQHNRHCHRFWRRAPAERIPAQQMQLAACKCEGRVDGANMCTGRHKCSHRSQACCCQRHHVPSLHRVCERL